MVKNDYNFSLLITQLLEKMKIKKKIIPIVLILTLFKNTSIATSML